MQRAMALPATTLGLSLLIAASSGCSSDDGPGPSPCPVACGPAQYCDANAAGCVACPAGQQNCDNLPTNGCECLGTCAGTVCTPAVNPQSCTPSVTGTSSCGVAGYCDAGTGQCAACPTGQHNCNLNDGDYCECAAGCSGTQCATTQPPPDCDHAQNNACGSTMNYCTPDGRCEGCPTNQYNCDGDNTNACECNNGCSGTQCSAPPTPCGDKECDSATEMCAIYIDSTENYWCKPVPAECVDDRSCSCEKVKTEVCSEYFNICGDYSLQENTVTCECPTC